MSKVLTARPRVGGHFNKLNREQSEHKNDLESLDETPHRQGMRSLYNDRKVFSDLINPLYRFLLGCVGRHWNDIYSEIRQQINPNSTTQRHLLEHVGFFVEQKVKMLDGRPYHALDFLPDSYCKIPKKKWVLDPIESGGRYKKLYINPDTGSLCLAPQKIFKKEKREITLIQVNKNLQLRKQGEIWYGLELSILPPKIANEHSTKGFDSFLKKSLIWIKDYELQYFYGKNLYCSKIWQLGRKELDRWVHPTLKQS